MDYFDDIQLEHANPSDIQDGYYARVKAKVFTGMKRKKSNLLHRRFMENKPKGIVMNGDL